MPAADHRQRRAQHDAESTLTHILQHLGTTPCRLCQLVGQISGPNPDADTNPTTQVVARFGPNDWQRRGRELVIRHTLQNVEQDLYARVRGTNTDQAEPLEDGLENPWSDLWFYSNPVFVHLG